MSANKYEGAPLRDAILSQSINNPPRHPTHQNPDHRQYGFRTAVPLGIPVPSAPCMRCPCRLLLPNPLRRGWRRPWARATGALRMGGAAGIATPWRARAFPNAQHASCSVLRQGWLGVWGVRGVCTRVWARGLACDHRIPRIILLARAVPTRPLTCSACVSRLPCVQRSSQAPRS